MAKNYEEFRTYGKKMVDYICDYIKDMDQKLVSPVNVEPGFLAPQLQKELQEYPESYEQCIDDFDKKILPGCVHWNHSNFFAYFGNGNTYPSVLGDMLSTAMAAVGFSWSSCPALGELEAIVLDWYAKALGLPDFLLSKNSNPKSIGGGALQGSASDAIFACMMSARARAIKTLKCKNTELDDSVFLPRLVCYASNQAHSCVEKAAKMCLVKFRAIEPDSVDTMRGDALERQIEKDVALGLTPFFVVATAGTTGQVAFDNLEEIGEVCKKYKSLWYHVDGAYGGNSFCLPEMKKYMKGIEHIDSIEINANKLMMTGFDCTCMYLRDVKTFIEAFTIDPIYLVHQFNDDVVDLRHFGVPLTRRFRSLKFFFGLRMYGIKGMQSYVRRVMAAGKHFEKLVKADDRFEVRNEVICGLVCFRLLNDDSVNQEFLARMNASGKIHLTPAKCRGKYIIRFIAGQENANEEQVEAAWKLIKQFADELLLEMEQSGETTITRKLQRFDDAHMRRYAFTRAIRKDDQDPHLKPRLLDGLSTPAIVDTGFY